LTCHIRASFNKACDHFRDLKAMAQYSVIAEEEADYPYLCRDSYRYAKRRRADAAAAGERPLVLTNVR
jgi:hypothetical protein